MFRLVCSLNFNPILVKSNKRSGTFDERKNLVWPLHFFYLLFREIQVFHLDIGWQSNQFSLNWEREREREKRKLSLFLVAAQDTRNNIQFSKKNEIFIPSRSESFGAYRTWWIHLEPVSPFSEKQTTNSRAFWNPHVWCEIINDVSCSCSRKKKLKKKKKKKKI